jgi:hypothetical protein
LAESSVERSGLPMLGKTPVGKLFEFPQCASGSCLLVVGVILLSAAGCGRDARGPARAAVSGEVLLDEAPLKAGIIRFVPVSGTKGPVALTTIKDGRYQMSNSDGPVLGNNSIEIVATTADSPLAGATDIKAAWAEYAKTSSLRPPEVKIPKKYNRNSQLNVVVAASGDHTFDFKLVSQR